MAQASADRDLDAIKADLAQLRKDLEKMGERLMAEQAAKAESLKARINEKIDQIRGEAGTAYEEAKARGRASVQTVEATVQEHPLMSLAAAFGLGFIVALLLDRR